MTPFLLAAAAEDKESSPIGLVLILCLAVALVFLIRSMNKHLRKVGENFDQADEPDPATRETPQA